MPANREQEKDRVRKKRGEASVRSVFSTAKGVIEETNDLLK